MTKEWEEVIKVALAKYKREEANAARKKQLSQLKILRKYISIPIVVGLVALVAIYFFFGMGEVLKTLLSWVVGVTIVATVVAALGDLEGKKKKRF